MIFFHNAAMKCYESQVEWKHDPGFYTCVARQLEWFLVVISPWFSKPRPNSHFRKALGRLKQISKSSRATAPKQIVRSKSPESPRLFSFSWAWLAFVHLSWRPHGSSGRPPASAAAGRCTFWARLGTSCDSAFTWGRCSARIQTVHIYIILYTYRRWTKYETSLLSGTTPSPPKFSVNVTWSAFAPMDERNQTPNISLGNTRAETLRFGGAGFNIVRVAGFEYVVHLLYVYRIYR